MKIKFSNIIKMFKENIGGKLLYYVLFCIKILGKVLVIWLIVMDYLIKFMFD